MEIIITDKHTKQFIATINPKLTLATTHNLNRLAETYAKQNQLDPNNLEIIVATPPYALLTTENSGSGPSASVRLFRTYARAYEVMSDAFQLHIQICNTNEHSQEENDDHLVSKTAFDAIVQENPFDNIIKWNISSIEIE